MADYLLYDPTADELRGIITVAPEQLAYNVEGGKLIALELDGIYRDVRIEEGRMIETFDLDAIRRPLLRAIDREALERMSSPLDAIHAEQAAEARGEKPHFYLTAIAERSGKSVGEIIGAVLAEAEAADSRKASANALRLAAKDALRAADQIPDMVRAATVAWDD